MFRRAILVALTGAALALPSLAPAQSPAASTVEVAGIKYEKEATLAGSKLQLNGAGLRTKLLFKVYTAGLYLNGGKASTPEAVLAAPGPKRMHIVMLREIDANELGKLFTRGMEDNASREDFAKAIPGTIKLGEIFAERKRLNAGDYFYVDYVPGTGTSIVVNGKPASDPIKEPEFFNSLLKIWLGKSPADASLKSALLGVEPAPTQPSSRRGRD